MKTYLFIVMTIFTIAWALNRGRAKPSINLGLIDAIVPAYNEEICITTTVNQLMRNPYFNKVIVVNDGSTDGTAAVLKDLARTFDRLVVIHQTNTGKGGALMNGVRHSGADYVLLTDADTVILPERQDIGHLLALIEDGADAVGGIPASDLNGAGFLPHLRATVKLPMIALQRTFQQITGGAPFLISGACGLFRREVLLDVPFSDRTQVEDLDLTWSLMTSGYKVRQSNRCIVYSQECNSLKAEWLRWKRWIIGYAVCMRLHKKLLLTRYGLFSIFPMFLVVVIGIAVYTYFGTIVAASDTPVIQTLMFVFPLLWVVIVTCISAVSAYHYRRVSLLALAPLAVFYVLFAYAIWFIHGYPALFTGRESATRDKPVRYALVVD